MRRTTILRSLPVLPVALGLLLASCGGDGDGDPPSAKDAKDAASATSTAPDDAAGAGGDDTASAGADDEMQSTLTLAIRLTHVGGKGSGLPVPTGVACDKRLPATCSGEITCPAPKGDRRTEVCAWLETPEGISTITIPPPEGQVCTEQYGGPETATVTGSIEGHPVNASFRRTNGCEISRFDAASPLWTGEVPKGRDGGPAPSAPQPPTATAPPHPEVTADPPEAFDR